MGVRAALLTLLVAGCAGGAEDFDGDGSTDAVDCAPEDPTIHPGADDETADGVDQDCDGVDGPDGAGDDDAGDDDVGDDDDDDGAAGHRNRLCAAAGTSSNGQFTATTCTGPLEGAPGVASNGTWTVRIGELRPLGGAR